MEITEIFYPKTRAEWRRWLKRNHRKKSEVWVRKPLKSTGEPCISYDDLVEECLCFGWIDGVVKKYEPESSVQRITPRRKKGSSLSELNRQRIWKLQRLELMMPVGLEVISDQLGSPDDSFDIPVWIEEQLKADRKVWKNFQGFSKYYQRLKVSWITATAGGKMAQVVARQRLDHLIKMTGQGKRYGCEPMADLEL